MICNCMGDWACTFWYSGSCMKVNTRQAEGDEQLCNSGIGPGWRGPKSEVEIISVDKFMLVGDNINEYGT